MRTVVLVHGAWHGPWCWAAVLAGLDELGVPAVAVDLPGPDLHADADHVRGVLDGLDADAGAVLVGHSYGGAVITDAGTHPAVQQLVYLCALVPDQGESCAAIGVGGGEAVDLSDLMQIGDDGMATLDLSRVRDAFYDDCDDVDVERATSLLRPQPIACMFQSPREIAWRERPTTYAVCGTDRAVAPAFQRGMAARIPGAAIVDWPTASHSPFFSMPTAVVELLGGLAA